MRERFDDAGMEFLEKPRNADEDVRLDARDVTHDFARVGNIEGLRTAPDGAQVDHALKEVGERQPARLAATFGKVGEGRKDGLGSQTHLAMAVFDPLGYAGRSGGEDDRRRRVGTCLIPVVVGGLREQRGEVHDLCRIACGIPRRDADDEAQRAADLFAELVEQRRTVDDDSGETATPRDVLHVLIRPVQVEAYGDTASRQDGELGIIPFLAGGGQDADAFASGQPLPAQTTGQRSDSTLVVGPGTRPPIPFGRQLPQRNRLGRSRAACGKQSGNGPAGIFHELFHCRPAHQTLPYDSDGSGSYAPRGLVMRRSSAVSPSQSRLRLTSRPGPSRRRMKKSTSGPMIRQ